MKYLVSRVMIPAIMLVIFDLTGAWAVSPEEEKPALEAATNGGLLVFPKRVVLSERERSAVMTLMNRSSRVTTFRLDLIDFRMDEEGRLIPDKDVEADKTLKGLVRFSPRQVKIEAGGQQTVRVFVRKPPDLEPGEYRSHLHLRALPSTDLGPRLEDFQGEEDNALSLRITALPAISLPIIVRHGDLEASVELEILELLQDRQGSPVLSLRLDRQGNRSVYGDMAAYWRPPGGNDEIAVGRAKGVAVYTSIHQRDLNLALSAPKHLDWGSGTLRVAFETRPNLDGGGPQLSAQREFLLP